MAGAFRILLWAVVLLAPGGILLAPVLAAHELRRRSRAAAARAAGSAAEATPGQAAQATAVAAVAEPSGQLAA